MANPVLIESANLSAAWGRTMLHAWKQSGTASAPMVLSVSRFVPSLPPEDQEIRNAVDQELLRCGKVSVRISGMTIFPYDTWCRRGRPPCREYSDFCTQKLLPRMKAQDRRNQKGTYFERIMAYTGINSKGARRVDQLSTVVDLIRNGNRWPRHSALQIACFDPAKDHTGQPVRGFPCLQQIGIAREGERGIALNVYYPTQYIFDRGYGNYLGLCHLGAFIAHETGREFVRLTCFVGQPQRGTVTKSALRGLIHLLEEKIEHPFKDGVGR